MVEVGAFLEAEGIGCVEATKVGMVEAVAKVGEGAEGSFGLKVPGDEGVCGEAFSKGGVAMVFEGISFGVLDGENISGEVVVGEEDLVALFDGDGGAGF